MKKKVTLIALIISILYGMVLFFFVGVIIRLIANFTYTRSVFLDDEDIFKVFVMSLIAGVAGGIGSWIFSKIEESKCRKSDPD